MTSIVKSSLREPQDQPGKAAGRRPGLMRTALVGMLALALLVMVLMAASCNRAPAVPSPASSPRAVIVDQLSGLYANPEFISVNTAVLRAAGYQVEVISGEAVTVDFWRDLPTRGYRLVILREHAGVNEEFGPDSQVWIFTNEPYTRYRYTLAQLRDQVTGAKTREADAVAVFTVSARFIRDCQRGDFEDTVILNMGCAAFHSDELARAFIDSGAAAYLAWDASVGIDYIDRAATVLIEKLYSRGLTLENAALETMQTVGMDPNHGAGLRYYPPANSTLTVRELVQQ